MGPPPSVATDLVDIGYINSEIAATNVQQSAIDATIANGLASYVNKSYVDQQNLLNATAAQVNAGDATRLHVAQLGADNGIAPLNAYGRVDKSRVPLGSTQRWPAPYYSPSAYQSGVLTLGGSETTLYTYTQPDPGFAYKLMVMGLLEGRTVTDGTPVQAIIRLASATGIPIATGYSTAESYPGAVLFTFATPGPFTFPIPSFAASFDFVLLGAGGGGESGSVFGPGGGGGAGSITVGSVVLGSATLPSGITALNGVVGTGGAGAVGGSTTTDGTAGTASTLSYYQTTLTAAAGAGGSSLYAAAGVPVATEAYNNYTYTTTGYGSGGAGGTGFQSTAEPGVAGEGGIIWILVHPIGGDANYSGIPIIPLALSAQSRLTGPQTLLARVAGSTGSLITPNYPGLSVVPIPA